MASAIYAAEGLLLYGFVFRLPFFYDDLPITAWVAGHSWSGVLRFPEAGYYRPLPYLIHKLGLLLPQGSQQPALHAVNLGLLCIGAMLIRGIVMLLTQDERHATLAGALYIAFPFLGTTIPWISAMPHPLVTVMTLLAAYAALRAEATQRHRWYLVTLAAIPLAGLSHESGAVAGAIVGGVLLLQRIDRRRIAVAMGAIVLTLVTIGLRPAASELSLTASLDLSDPLGKAMFFSQSLLYPVMPLVSWLVRTRGWNDLALVAVADGVFALVAAALLTTQRSTRAWLAPALWWWACASLPAALFFNFAALYVAPRLYSLGGVGSVIVWAGLIATVGRAVRGRAGVAVQMAFAIAVLVPGMAHISNHRVLHLRLADLYSEVVDAAQDQGRAPMGLVNLPHNLAWNRSMYPLVRDSVVFVPWYASVEDFVRINGTKDVGDLEIIVYGPVLKETELFLGVEGTWLETGQMATFASRHATVWLAQESADGHELTLREVGAVASIAPAGAVSDFVSYTNGPEIVSADAQSEAPGTWRITLWWKSSGPVEAEIFVHVYDESGALIAQADGPALGGLVPIRTWPAGQYLRDVRYTEIPPGATPPFRVGVGIYTSAGRFPAYALGQRAVEDSALVVTIPQR